MNKYIGKEYLQPPRGMRDFGPDEAFVRGELVRFLEDTLRSLCRPSPWKPVELPAMEHLAIMNQQITNDQGESVAVAGENQKLIFPVLKRGDQLETAIKAIKDGNGETQQLAKEGLVFDHTLSLMRYHVNTHGKGKGDLPSAAFQYYQIGPVWRAERPQAGRFRQFMQFDLDYIYGPHSDSSQYLNYLFSAVIKLYDKVKEIYGHTSKDGYIYRNSTELSKKRFKRAKVPLTHYSEVARILDKYHKIGSDKVAEELKNLGIDQDCINTLLDKWNIEELRSDKMYIDSKEGKERLVKGGYDPFLLRGMNYYSGYMFELRDEQYKLALGGGGSYDGLAKKLFDAEWGGVGFSFGFERIYELLKEKAGMEKLKDWASDRVKSRL